MIWRLIFVVWVLALLAGAGFYFSDELFGMTDYLRSQDEAGRKRILDLLEIVGKGLGILGVLLAFVAAIWKWITPGSKGGSGDTYSNTFEKDVSVHGGDFVLGNKTVKTGSDKDAG